MFCFLVGGGGGCSVAFVFRLGGGGGRDDKFEFPEIVHYRKSQEENKTLAHRKVSSSSRLVCRLSCEYVYLSAHS
jgi:hypothetical protein